MYVSGLKELIDGLALPSGRSRRIDCPGCGGRNTFSVTNDRGTVVFNCFKASCDLHGATGGSFTLDDIRKILEPTPNKAHFVIPDYFVPDVMYKGVGTFRDIRERRQVFIVKSPTGKIIDAIGRSPSPDITPKWKRYASSSWPFVAGPYSGIAVLVEDVYSAIAVSCTMEYTGVALLGTNLHDGYSEWAKLFKGVIVALDYDASGKGVDISRKLSWTLPSTSIILKRDLKVYEPDEIKNQLREARKYIEANV